VARTTTRRFILPYAFHNTPHLSEPYHSRATGDVAETATRVTFLEKVRRDLNHATHFAAP
jgi:hypothetical protein